jgi:putative thioredoxin
MGAGAVGTVVDATAETFEQEAIVRSRTVPVVVDFWAAWCGPCRTLGPMLEAAVERRAGVVVLVKVDVDRAQALAQRFGVQGIPAVMGLRDGRVVDRFTGAVPASRIEALLDAIAPSAEDRALAAAAAQDPESARATLEAALATSPAHPGLAIALAELLVAGDPARARELVARHPGAPGADRVMARAALAEAADADVAALRPRAEAGDPEAATALARALAASGSELEALDVLLRLVESSAGEAREAGRRELLALFSLLGDDHPHVAPARSRLARALF